MTIYCQKFYNKMAMNMPKFGLKYVKNLDNFNSHIFINN